MFCPGVLRIQQEDLQRRQGQGAPDEGRAGHGTPRGGTAADHLLRRRKALENGGFMMVLGLS